MSDDGVPVQATFARRVLSMAILDGQPIRVGSWRISPAELRELFEHYRVPIRRGEGDE